MNYSVWIYDQLWDAFNRKLIIVAIQEGLKNQLDFSYCPKDKKETEPDEMENKYFYSVLNHYIRKNNGEQIIRKVGYPNLNSRKTYRFLFQEMTKTVEMTHDLAPFNERICNKVRIIMLQKAVSKVTELKHMKSTLKVQRNPGDYNTYFDLLKKAAVTYDKDLLRAKNKSKVNFSAQNLAKFSVGTEDYDYWIGTQVRKNLMVN